MRLTCNRFLAGRTLLSIQFAETVYTVWILIFGNKPLSRQLGFTPSTHKAFFMPRLVMVGHSPRSYYLMYWQKGQSNETKVWILKDYPVLHKSFHLFFVFPYAQEKRLWSRQQFFIWNINLTNCSWAEHATGLFSSIFYHRVTSWFVIHRLACYVFVTCVDKGLASSMLSEEQFSVMHSGWENRCWDYG